TNVDPIRYNLLFERFLNPERISMPDIDVDFCKERRGEVIDYVTDLYGRDHVAQIITFGTMQARAVIRDVGRAMDVPYSIVDKVAKLVPSVLGITLTEALKQEPKLKEMYNTDSKIKELIDIALRLEGLTRHASTHAAGIVISPEPLNNFLPLYKVPNDNTITTQFGMESIESLGLLKFDFLGLKTLSVLHKAETFINQHRATNEKPFSVRDITFEDKDTYRLLSSGRTNAVFQLESSGMKELLVRAKPETFEDVVALLALYRPGPLGEGMDVEFVNRKHGKTPIQYEHPMLEPVLKETYGVILYQEQVMQIANRMANFTMGQADILRKAMGKKKAEVMEKLKNNFIEGAKQNKIQPKKAERIFDIMASFAKYGFNKSHSAAYALITYQTAYLKSHYPVEFMAATLSSEMDNTDKIVKYINECREMNIEILPPEINHSGREFQISGKSIRFGLEAIKGVGAAAIESIIEVRANGEFKDLPDLCDRVETRKVNKRVMESLIKAGAMSSMGKRSQLMAVLDQAMDIAARANKSKSSLQVSLFHFQEAPALKLPEMEEWDKDTILKMEKEAVGFYISGHPLEKYKSQFKRLSILSTSELQEKPDDTMVTFGGLVQACKKMNTKKGEPMAYLTLEDLYGTVDVVCFPDLYKQIQSDLSSDSPIVLTGKLENTEQGIKIIASKALTLEKAVENPSALYQAETPKWGNGNYGRKNGANGSNGRAAVHKISRVELFIDEKTVKPDAVSQLKELILKHHGDCLVCVRVRCLEPTPCETTISTMLHAEATAQFRAEAEQILGTGSVSYI
ncbi:MAG TPA: DNA polymerase III subunit alpha, partial [Thermodesulfovibrionia bacterium]|nr:DNA polymerase III subunit alpha [Thermodesulfovibrionia bacterium]